MMKQFEEKNNSAHLIVKLSLLFAAVLTVSSVASAMIAKFGSRHEELRFIDADIASIKPVDFSIDSAKVASDTIILQDPQLEAHINFNGNDFQQKITVHIHPAVNLERSRLIAEKTDYLTAFSPFVTSARYQLSDPKDERFWLTIGKSGFNYTHMFHCRETIEQDEWRQVCEEDSNLPKGEKVIFNATRSTICSNRAAADTSAVETICEFILNGSAKDLSVLILKVPARQIAYTLFSEATKYVTGISLLMAGAADTPSAANAQIAQILPVNRMLNEIETTAAAAKASTASPLDYHFSSVTESAQFAYVFER